MGLQGLQDFGCSESFRVEVDFEHMPMTHGGYHTNRSWVRSESLCCGPMAPTP